MALGIPRIKSWVIGRRESSIRRLVAVVDEGARKRRLLSSRRYTKILQKIETLFLVNKILADCRILIV